MTNKENFEIGDKVNIKVNDIVCTGELLALHQNTPHIDFWIVLIDERLTEFMINRPEKGLVIGHNYLEKIE